MQLRYSTEEVLADHPFARLNYFGERRLHGGYDADGVYQSPRTLGRWPAIHAWQQNLTAHGGELIDASTRLLHAEHSPTLPQMKLLLANGVTLPLWNSLTITGIIEGRGRMLAGITAPDFQALVEEDLSETATAHLNKGLFVAHGLDEGGDGTAAIGAHDQMWYLARDLVLGENAHPIPEIPERGGRPGADGREMPQIPPQHEALLKQLMNVLMIEIRAERGFAFNVDLMSDPEAFPDRPEKATQAATIINQIRQDEAPHVAYLQLFISELRELHFKTGAGSVLGKSFIDPVWAKIVAWNSDDVPRIQQKATREQVEACLKTLPNGAAVLAQYDAIGAGLGVAAE
ncbi:MAG TPA: hypothetical protein VHW60_09530 [Caulobacteraceae bacterium]|jgi:hypothetical protein|nr:hypothetical protein [Caulobacteraceae bacterium]